MNAHLSATDYHGGEFDWALVTLEGGQPRTYEFDREKKSDVLYADAVTEDDLETLPPGFVPVDCAQAQVAVLAKASRKSREFLVLGRLSDNKKPTPLK